MTDTTQKRVRPIGGFLENLIETVAGTGTGYTYVNEGPVRGQNLEDLRSLPEHTVSGFSKTGEITGFQTPRQERTDQQLILEQQAAVPKATSILRQSRAGFIAEEEVRLEVAGMGEEDKNKRLGLNISYRGEHTNTAYHRAELYRQRKAELQISQQQAEAPIPSPAKQPNALDTQFEGGAGRVGTGQANLKFGIG